ncbi:hypothetical protein BHE74_00029699 [Ensete ventricosum]|nr:hypothetical protein BHE74_00029699 [Ensete ventricosum]
MSLRSKVCHTGPYRHTEIISIRYGTRYQAVCTVHTARCRGELVKVYFSSSSPSSSSPFSYFSLNRPLTVESDRRWPISVLPPGSERSAYRSTGGPVCTARRRVWGISALGPAGKNKDAVDSPLNGQSIRETKLKLGIKIRDTDHREIERERRLSAPVKFPSSTAM